MADADGHFVLTDLRPGRREIIAEAPGYDTSRFGQLTARGSGQAPDIQPGQKIQNVTIQLWKFAALSGAVVDEIGEPLVGVTIQAWRKQADPRVLGQTYFVLQSSAALTTDDRGYYRISVPPGEYVVVLPSTAFVTTRELGASQSPAASASLSIHISDPTSLIARATPPVVRNDGRVLAYQNTFFPAAASSEEATSLVALSGEELSGLNLRARLVPTVRVRGTVTLDAQPSSGRRVTVVPTYEAGFAVTARQGFVLSAAVTDREGAFELTGVPSGRYIVRVMEAPTPSRSPSSVLQVGDTRFAAGSAVSTSEIGETLWFETSVDIGDVDPSPIQVRLNRGYRVRGRVVFESEGISNAALPALQRTTIFLTGTHAMSVPAGVIQADGSFATSGYPAGKYLLSGSLVPSGWAIRSAMVDGRDISDRPVDLQRDVDNVVVTLTNRSATLQGAVRNLNGQADSGAAVLVFPADYRDRLGDGVRQGRFVRSRVSTGGEFSIASLAEGDYLVVAVSDLLLPEFWQSAAILQRLAGLATRTTVRLGQVTTQNLTTQEWRSQ